MVQDRKFVDPAVTTRLNAIARNVDVPHIARAADVPPRDVHLACAGEPVHVESASRLEARFSRR